MSRYRDGDDYDGDPEQILAWGRWKRNAEQVLKSKRGRKALAEIREALLALPDKRLISGAMCTVGDVDARFPVLTDEEIAADAARINAWHAEYGAAPMTPEDAAFHARFMRDRRDEERKAYQAAAEREGPGCCINGALVWHRKVRDGAGPAEAFAALPPVIDADDGDALEETARLGEEAGLAFTMAWELAYRNDETYAGMSPETRYTAFLAWIDRQLATAP